MSKSNLRSYGQQNGGIKTVDDVLARCVEDAGCWIWQGACKHSTRANNLWAMTPCAWWPAAGRIVSVARIVMALHGRTGDKVWRVCESERCVNPEHLRVGSYKQWGSWAAKSGKCRTAVKLLAMQRCGRLRSRLSDEDIEAIRASSASGLEIAAQYGISKTHVSRIRLGKSRRGHATSVFGWRP